MFSNMSQKVFKILFTIIEYFGCFSKYPKTQPQILFNIKCFLKFIDFYCIFYISLSIVFMIPLPSSGQPVADQLRRRCPEAGLQQALCADGSRHRKGSGYSKVLQPKKLDCRRRAFTAAPQGHRPLEAIFLKA